MLITQAIEKSKSNLKVKYLNLINFKLFFYDQSF